LGSPRIEALLYKAQECDRKASSAGYADVRRAFMDLAEQARAMARQLKAMESPGSLRAVPRSDA
jgi:hypothetical protein